MIIKEIHIKGFRNYVDETIIFDNKNFIIGANDIGKTNLIYALRLLFDKSISEEKLELTDSDYNAYSEASEIIITVKICNITEDCLLGVFAGAVKDGTTVIRYSNSKDGQYSIWNGYDEDVLTEIGTRRYIKRLDMQCIDTKRDLISFFKKEKEQILKVAKEKLSDELREKDEIQRTDIQNKLNGINTQINALNYITLALNNVNKELDDLSIHNEDQLLRFFAGDSDADKLLDNLVLSYSTGNSMLSIGGDGRNNQIYIATWIAKQNIEQNIDHVTFYAIEEPEAHLHPHQQRKLAQYIQSKFSSQIFLTTHSPHIVTGCEPKYLIRLFGVNKLTHASSGGCSPWLELVFKDFGYRLNVLSAEIFFSDGVFLVEGTSEVILYKSIAKEIGIDLDRFNISILSVEGVGFKPYVAVCNALNIPWVLRTDNDVFSKPNKNPNKDYYAGISRIMGILSGVEDDDNELVQYWKEHAIENEWTHGKKASNEAVLLNKYVRNNAIEYNLFLSDKDLENDLAKSKIKKDLYDFYGKKTIASLVKEMQKRKAENMLLFINSKSQCLKKLSGSNILKPIERIVSIVLERNHPTYE